jgi:O-antigen/teichoic acid export membrane protein
VFASLAWTLVRGPHDLLEVGWAEIGAVTALTAYCLYIQHSAITPFRLRGSMQGFSNLIRESATAGSSNVVWAMSQYAPLFMMGALVGGVETAWFAAAARVVGSLIVVSYVYHYGLYPAIARATARRDGSLAPLLARSCRVTAWGGIYLALALTLLAEPLMLVAMGPKLAASAPILQVLAWVLPVSLCSGHARWALAAAGAQIQVLWAQLAGLIVTIGAGLALGSIAGGVGFAFGALAGFVAVWATAHVLAVRHRCHPPPLRVVLRPALAAAAILVAAHLVQPGLLVSLGALVAYAAAAPLVDRRLLSDLAGLGRDAGAPAR